jgi:hypothetical protein
MQIPDSDTILQAKLALAKLADTCAKKNHHKWQEYYIDTKVYIVHHAVVILTACVNHALH